jgi:integrase
MPVIGPSFQKFSDWLSHRGYSRKTIRHRLGLLPQLSRRFRRQGVDSFSGWTPQRLDDAEKNYRRERSQMLQMARSFRQFLQEQALIPVAKPGPMTPSQEELMVFGAHLREVRGLAESAIVGHQRRLRPFLSFLHFDQQPRSLARLVQEQIEQFLRQAARRNNRFSLQNIVSSLRALLRFEHARGRLSRPWHQQIDTPRVYRQERLPRAWSWDQVQLLLRSIKPSDAQGWRDRTILYLAAAYGLRSSELVHLKLDDLDWRHETLRINQIKTHHALYLPLSGEAGDVLLSYLRRGRPQTGQREVFFRLRAPAGPLMPSAVYHIFAHRLRDSGLAVPPTGPHVLRHSLAVELLRQRVSLKAIGDVLGHRHAASTLNYVRLSVDDLRTVGLEVPQGTSAAKLLAPGWEDHLPAGRRGSIRKRARGPLFQSGFRVCLKNYLATKCALGRQFVREARVLRDWDSLLYRQQGRAAGFSQTLLDRWRKTLTNLSPTEHRRRLIIVRNFLLFYARQHPGVFMPDLGTFPRGCPPHPPRLVTMSEMGRVLAVADQLEPLPSHPLRAATAKLALILLFCCGLRRGELLRLRLEHLNLPAATLRIEETKFHKSRLVPLSDSVSNELRCYLDLRRQHQIQTQPDSPLVWNGQPAVCAVSYSGTGLARIWYHLCLTTGVLDQRGRPPRLHDLRHSFVAAALQRWYAQDTDVQSRLPLLATYLGHVSPASTHYYVQWTPALQQAASQRFHQACASLVIPGGAL